jgi:hypothetical protein
MPQIPLTKGQFAFVDDCDYDALILLGKWCYSNSGYAVHYCINENGKRQTLYMHRAVMQRILGKPILNGLQVDHISGATLGAAARLDNRRANLRLATRSQNQAHKGRQSNTSCYKGVNLNAGLWEARIRFQGKRVFLGKYENALAAATMYDAASRHLYQDFAGCNFPDKPTPSYVVEALGRILSRRGL